MVIIAGYLIYLGLSAKYRHPPFSSALCGESARNPVICSKDKGFQPKMYYEDIGCEQYYVHMRRMILPMQEGAPSSTLKLACNEHKKDT